MRIFLIILSMSFVAFLLVIILNSPILMMVIVSSFPFGSESAPICSLEVLESRDGIHRIRYNYSGSATGAHTSDIWVKDLKGYREMHNGCTWVLRESCDFVGENRLQYFSKKGELIEDSYFQDERLHGPYRSWYENGILEREAYYENGQCIGVKRHYTKTGSLKSEWECHPSVKGSFTYDELGNIKSRSYIILEDGDKIEITDKYENAVATYREFRLFVNGKVSSAFQPDITVNAMTRYDHFISDGIKVNAESCWRRNKSLEEIENQSIILPNSYEYYATIGADSDLKLFLPTRGSYFYYQNEDGIESKKLSLQKILNFPEEGYFLEGRWQNGDIVTAGISLVDLPHGVFLQWYEPLQQKYWEVDYQFSKDLFDKLKAHCFRNLKHGGKRCFLQPYNAFSFKFDILQEGRVNLFISGGGETYLLGELRGNPKELKHFSESKSFKKQYQYLIDQWYRLSQEIHEEQVAAFNAENLNLEQAMSRYHWKVTGSDLYRVKGSYYLEFFNGETYHVDKIGRNLFRERSAAPKEIIVYIEGSLQSPTPGAIKRVRFKFDDEAIEKFSTFRMKDGGEVQLVISMSPTFKKFRMYLTDGKSEVRLTPIFSAVEMIPEEYQLVLEKDEDYIE